MTRDDIIRMATQCQLVHAGNREGLYMDALAEFAELVTEKERNRIWTQDHWTEYERGIAAAEREACAQEADAEASIEGIAQRIAAAIRARGQA